MKSDENMVSFPRVYPRRLVLFPLYLIQICQGHECFVLAQGKCNVWCSFASGRPIEDMFVSTVEPLDRLSPDNSKGLVG